MAVKAWMGALAAAAIGGPVWGQVDFDTPGLPSEVRDAIEAVSLTQQTQTAEENAPQDFVAAAQADYGRIVAVLYEYGYFAPVVSITVNGTEAAVLSPLVPPARIEEIVITVEAGEVFAFGETRIEPLAPGTEIPDQFATGQTATTPAMRRAVEAGIDGWRQDGHATAELEDQSIVANNATYIVDVAILLSPGPEVTFGNLIPQGQERMRPERIVEIAGLPTGTVYDPDEIARAEERLRDAGVFRVAALREQPLGRGDVMDITAVLEELPLRRFGVGAEYSSVDGGTLTAFWLHRNLFGGAERLRFDAEVAGIGGQTGGIDYILATGFRRPATFHPDTTFTFGAAVEVLQEPAFDLLSFATEAALERQLTPDFSYSYGVGYQFADIDDALGERQIMLITLPLAATYDTRDVPLDARDGLFANPTATPFVTDQGTAGVRATTDVRGYLAFGAEDRTRIAGRLQFGSVFGSDRDHIPSDFLFFSGGGGSVRGQPFQSLGVEVDGDEVGGRGFAGLQAEVRQDIGERFGAVAFYDIGYISEEALGMSLDGETHSGGGLGVRYNTPIGPVRLDIATPLSGDRAGRAAILYLGIGQAF